uniref:Sulfatase N-terminal domain-containing protein n=1 Tax=Amazona collaria TaxID=241587 RepID=A0A8B9IXB7_9PSIT
MFYSNSCWNRIFLFRTPNIDGLRVGVRLSQAIAVAAVCTPSKAAFLTGRCPIRSGLFISKNNLRRILFWNGCSGKLTTNETAFSRILHQRGYSTALVEKWHMGKNCKSRCDHCHHPLNHAFDYFHGMPFTLLSKCQGIDDPEPGKFSRYILALYSDDHPFILELEKKISNKLKEAVSFFESKHRQFLLLVSLLRVHNPLITTEKFQGRSKHSLNGDNVGRMDQKVGKLVDACRGNAQLGGWNGIYKGKILVVLGEVFVAAAYSEPFPRLDVWVFMSREGGANGTIRCSRHKFMFQYCGVFLHAVWWHQKDSEKRKYTHKVFIWISSLFSIVLCYLFQLVFSHGIRQAGCSCNTFLSFQQAPSLCSCHPPLQCEREQASEW